MLHQNQQYTRIILLQQSLLLFIFRKYKYNIHMIFKTFESLILKKNMLRKRHSYKFFFKMLRNETGFVMKPNFRICQDNTFCFCLRFKNIKGRLSKPRIIVHIRIPVSNGTETR
uniref:Uncharacterized protein n=1 Tax=Lepeophtheirus salmonis TaxID=72036 RepID=A0A0K2VFQ7_LEPSM